MSQSNVALIQRFEDSFVAGDLSDVLSILAEDITVHEPDNVPYPGDHRGKDAFLALATAFGATWDIQGDLRLDIMPAGDHRVLVLVEFDAIARPTGEPITLRIAEIYTITDGLISDIVVHYWDTAEMVKATTGTSVRSAGA
jgi:ketosteroid isomerase-like protein